jgi:hypothetical protein
MSNDEWYTRELQSVTMTEGAAFDWTFVVLHNYFRSKDVGLGYGCSTPTHGQVTINSGLGFLELACSDAWAYFIS